MSNVNFPNLFTPATDYDWRTRRRHYSQNTSASIYLQRILCQLLHGRTRYGIQSVEQVDKNTQNKLNSVKRKDIEDIVYAIFRNAGDKFRIPLVSKHIVGSGGFYETPEIIHIDDCDYNIVLDIPSEWLSFDHQCNMNIVDPLRTHPKRYFKARFSNSRLHNMSQSFIDNWKCAVHEGFNINCDCVLRAYTLQQEFKVFIVSRLQLLYPNIKNISDSVSIQGPAVTFALHVQNDEANIFRKTITVDLALALPLKQDWRTCECLCTISPKALTPHMVCAGDYWRLSFSQDETRIITNCSPRAKQVFVATKILRNEVPDVADLHTYPLKQAFLHQLADIEDDVQEMKRGQFVLAKYVKGLVSYIIARTGEGRFTNYFQENDSVIEVTDGDYQLCKKFADYIQTQEKLFRSKGKMHSVYIIFLLVLHIMLGCYAFTVYKDCEHYSIEKYQEPLVLLIIASVLTGVNIFILLYFIMKRNTFMPAKMYNLYACHALLTYAISCVMTVLPVVICWCAHVINSYECTLSIVSMVLSAVVLLYYVVQGMAFVSFACDCKRCDKFKIYKYECIFIQQICCGKSQVPASVV